MRTTLRLAAALFASVLAGSAFAADFNAVTDFSGTNNPNGVWSYLDGNAGLLTEQITTLTGPGWYNGLGFPNASLISVNAGATDVISGTVILGADSLHLDGQGLGVALRFNTVAGGSFSVDGEFVFGDTQMVTHTVSIRDNLGTLLFSSLLANGQTAAFALSNVALGSGGYLDFISGTDGGASFAGTNLRASLASNVEVPEPATIALLGCGLAGLGLLRRKRG